MAGGFSMNELHTPDPIFLHFDLFEGIVPAGFNVECTGALVSTAFKGQDDPATRTERYIKTSYPPAGEDLFEYLSVLKSINAARDKFVMVELGAGYGRWLVTAAKAIQRRKAKGNLPFYLVGVEADPVHFQMMTEHFQNNGIVPEARRLVQAAVTKRAGESWFTTGSPHIWWGQAIVESRHYSGYQYPDQKTIQVQSVTLASILQPLDSVDLIDLDIQGEEFNVLSSALEILDAKVKRLHIGTHSRPAEQNLRKMMRRLGWTSEHDYPYDNECDTPFGRIAFIDGIQTWINNKTFPSHE
jgi:FkbM family methyltransferase